LRADLLEAFLSCIDADSGFLEVTETDFEKYEKIKKEFIVGQENELLRYILVIYDH
jgi:hypothetical protein